MRLQEEIELIKKAQQNIAELDLQKTKIFSDLCQEIKPTGRLESTMWDYTINGIQCYLYDIESLLRNRHNSLD